MRPLLLSCLAAAVVACAPMPAIAQHDGANHADRAALVARIDSLALDHLTNGPAASMAVAVVRGSDTIVMRGYGFADLQTKRSPGPNTMYEIGSITKQFTSAAIMRLVEQGKISLDDDVSKYVPSFPVQGHRVTIRRLLNHTSGIHNYTSVPAWRLRWADDLTPDSILAFVAKDTLDFAAGSKWSYSNTGYVLLGMIVEKASGMPYARYLDEQFFKPLGLHHTMYCPADKDRDTSFAVGYSLKDGQLVPAAYLSMTQPFSAGALCSSVRDYLVWQRALHGGRVVTSTSYALMTTPDTLTNGKRLTYGFGLGVAEVAGHRAITHGGGINGYLTTQAYFPGDSLSVIVFTNTDKAPPDFTALNIARAVLGIPLEKRRPNRPPG